MFTDNTTYITTVLLSVSGIYQEKSEYYPHCHNKDLLLHKPAGRRLCFDLKHRRLVLYSARAPWIQYPTAFQLRIRLYRLKIIVTSICVPWLKYSDAVVN